MKHAVLWLVLLSACSGPPAGTVDVVGPQRSTFPPVHAALEPTCGTLDCHGQPGRSFQLWGNYGQRLAANDIPSDPDGGGDRARSSAEEIDASYRSLVALEPEIMADVMRDQGAHPERLTLIRKARGTEAHKGGTLMHEGDPLDRCITTWIAGTVDQSACAVAEQSALVP